MTMPSVVPSMEARSRTRARVARARSGDIRQRRSRRRRPNRAATDEDDDVSTTANLSRTVFSRMWSGDGAAMSDGGAFCFRDADAASVVEGLCP